ncbi:Actinorhodin polyketide putative beta-ketoacyl synthase 2 [Actinomadura rubteroloni]|uniref:Actinorhodin polyketide putative beta-ketoacyl synthase 2 n=1 Tax=Actinomadura rubteroloni TaxID=1926885 RepID=A0A2P4UEQ6_9ACTN|nr:beta-ketoacyl synthase N-terminal-like domain-containing protein [Actinomadura rubteroloni]POM23498.1 Actinorhodin polyketide putative beta-ketoacyl synthase 2 [Actinomadura rubteroloni]
MTAAVTGLGIVAPTGVGADEHWRATLAGELAVRPIEAFDASRYGTTLAGQITGFRVADHVPDRLAVQTDRWTWLALAAARLALADAAYDPSAHDPYATSVILGSGSGGNEFGQREIQALWSRGSRAVGAYQSIAWFYAASTGQVSIRHGTKGPSGVLVSDAAGGVDSLGWADRTIRRGTGAVLAGGTEAPLSPYALACQVTGGRMSAAADPRAAYKPFDTAANGHVPGEGGAVLVVEDADAAAERSAPAIYGVVAGHAATHDAHHYREAAPDGRQYARAIGQALDRAGVRPDEVDLVFADGAGTPGDDAAEAAALRAVFGPRGVPVTAPQGLVGRLCAGGSALNAATALLAMRAGVAPPVGNLDDPDPAYGLDLVREPRELRIGTVLVAARGHGGFNSALVLRRSGRTGGP